MSLRAVRWSLAASVALLLQAGSAAALTYTPTVTVGRVGGTIWDMLDPNVAASTLSDPDENGVQEWNLSGPFAPGSGTVYRVDSWQIELKEDPFVSNNVSITNLSGVTQTFVATVLLPIPAFAYNTVIASSVGVSYTDTNGDGALYFDIAPASTIYNGFVGFPASTSLLAMNPIVPLGTFPIDNVTDCFPPGGGAGCTAIASNSVTSLAVAPGVATLIGLTLTFQLAAGDSVGLTSRFEIVNVPEPATVALLGAGLVALALARRRTA
jgi:hypothetical protein